MPSTVSRMPRRSLTLRVAATLAALTLGASLTACADTTRIPPAPTDTGAAEPLFASDEEALAAAVEAYEEYAAVVDALLMGREPSVPLEAVASGALVEQTLEDVAEFAELGWVITEGRQTLNPRLQSRQPVGDGGELVVLYFCEDVSQVDVIDSAGESVVNEDRDPFTPFEATIRLESGDEPLVLERRVWEGSGICI
ncbi:hypothetical protein EV140_0999 [Microcella alkaliphila]|uniref:Uncharacterized protein n=2 Tax=Microcella alkaliphila TaxID=279828 RepID=A0A4Q7TR16_9MICO|nr:hypothetical protein EV140_0999 [Microcella alkaliphila]